MGKIADKIMKKKNKVTPDNTNDINDINASQPDLTRIDQLSAMFEDKMKVLDNHNAEMIVIEKEMVNAFVQKWKMKAKVRKTSAVGLSAEKDEKE